MLVTIIGFNSLRVVSADVTINENLFSGEIVQQKIYSTTSITDEFDDDKVIVVIFHEYSGLNKEFTKEDFPGVDIKNINYITSLKDPTREYPYVIDSF